MPSKFSNDSERREQVSTIQSSVNNRRTCSTRLKKSRFVKDVLFHPKNEVIAFPEIEIKWYWIIDAPVFITSDAVIWFWQYFRVKTRQTSENQITNCKCGATKLTGNMEFVLQQDEWISLFGHGTFQRFVFMLSTWFVWTSGNGLSNKPLSHFLFTQHLGAYLMLGLWWACLKYDNFFPNAGNWRINLWNW